jgi:hypothetical protein
VSQLAVALQVAPIDLDAAIDLADLLASLEGSPRMDTPMFIVFRRDVDMEGISFMHRTLATKFVKVFPMAALDFATGWPDGAAALWHSTLTNCSLAKQQGWITSTGVFTMEADCVPLRRNWIDCLQKEWQNRRDDVWVVGHHHGEGDWTHVNGNGIFSLDLLNDWPVLHGQPAGVAWDWFHRKLFLKISQDTPYITQFYKQPSLEEWQFRRVRKNGVLPAILHGVKNGSARAAARRLLVSAPSPA